MTRLTFYPAPVAGPGPVSYECAGDGCTTISPDKFCPACASRLGVVRHGYTLVDLEQLTRGALVSDRTMALGYDERREVAYSAIAEYLCAAVSAPSRSELIQAGWKAIARTVKDGYRSRGYPDGAFGADGPTMPRFGIYWGTRIVHSHEPRIVENVAVGQVLAELTPALNDAITALAIAEDYTKAAALLGISNSAFKVRISVARKQLLALWHDWETPHQGARRRDDRATRELAAVCGGGHEWTPENTRIQHRMKNGKRKSQRICRDCERERASTRRAAA